MQAMALHLPFLTSHTGYARLPQSDLETAEDATPLLEPDNASSEQTVHAEPTSHTKRTSRSERAARSHRASHTIRTQRTQRTGLTAQLERELDALEGRIPEEPSTRLEKIGKLVSSYIFSCILFAAACTVYASASTYASWYFLQTNEPYTSNFSIVYAGMLGATILSLMFTTVMWCYAELEEIYERAHGIYEPPSELPEWWTWQRETYVPPPPKLARRYAGSVTAFCTISGLLMGGLVGPVFGTVIRRGIVTSAMTASAALGCGAAGTGLVIGGILVCLSCTYGMKLCNGGRDAEC
ncbi:uncharacterized protein B0H18DRAFT_1051435 [Fomitopsis serialis]|uniref:uncharacterized protein n=1 Tax=Fomitopsis serialis TaxID=139415 RepID=UPI002008CE05|nr:uncharacterized protein B0H18DRAFT_1051435 [Neoantrodia serialis]KAH9912902.1 hypothetical protein B0H18DRAFT_1051435 [Neoantrodia serialis]